MLCVQCIQSETRYSAVTRDWFPRIISKMPEVHEKMKRANKIKNQCVVTALNRI